MQSTRCYVTVRGTELKNPDEKTKGEKDWKLGRLNHVAIAVPDLQKAMAMYRDVLGAKVSEPVVSDVAYKRHLGRGSSENLLVYKVARPLCRVAITSPCPGSNVELRHYTSKMPK